MTHAFFMNDEFLYIIGVKTEGLFFLLNSGSWLEYVGGVNRPLGTLLQNFFHLHYLWDIRPFVFTGISFQILNCLMVYAVAKKLSKNTIIAATSGILFASMNVATQAVDWLACVFEVPTSTFFALLCIYFTLHYLEAKKKYLLPLILCSAYVGFLLKDADIFLFVAVPVLLLIAEWKSKKKDIRFPVLSFGTAILLFGLRFARGTHRAVREASTLTPSALVTILGSGSLIGKIFYNSILFPMLGIIQSIVPVRYLQKFIDHPALSPHLTQVKIDLFFFVSAGLFCLLLFFLLKRTPEKKPLVILVVLYLSSFIPIVLTLIGRNSTFIEARYLYFSSTMISIFFGFVVYELFRMTRERRGVITRIVSTSILLFITVYTIKQIQVTRSTVYWDTTRQQEVKNVVMTLSKYKEQVPENPIFYINSDYDYYWPGNKLPVQEGVGFMLEVIFYDTGKIPKKLAQEFHFQNFGKQGYETSEGKGFGYYYDEKELATLFQNHTELSYDQIVGFDFASRDQSFTLVTERVREEVKKLGLEKDR